MKAVEILIPPDKSISHRAVMLASVSEGQIIIKNLLIAEDIKRTIEAFQAMGVKIHLPRPPRRWTTLSTYGVDEGVVVVHGVGMHGLKKPSGPLYLGNSGTTMRILPGILAGQDFEVVLTGDASLSKRPMKRIVEPLRKMGANISSSSSRGHLSVPYCLKQEIYPPLKIHGGKLKAINYKSRIASAQVKSCVLLAGLYANGVTSVTEPVQSRDHTERMLKIFGCRVFDETLKGKFLRAGTQPLGCRVSVNGPAKLKSPGTIEIPGDISSAAFFIVAGCILPDIKITIKNVGLNPTRTGVLDILKRMGADIVQLRYLPTADTAAGQVNEPVGDIIVKASKLKGVTISPPEVTRAIDEIPIIMVAACFAKGRTVIRGIEELRVKETDRIKSMVTNLRKIGAEIEMRGKYIVINGGKVLHGAKVSSFGDHRTAMSMLVTGLRTRGRVIVTGLDCINKSFPGFEKLLRRLKPAATEHENW